MCLCRRWLLTIILAVSSASSFAQETDSLILSEVDNVLTFDDSLSIFDLIDSILQVGDIAGSQLAARLGYNSNVLSAGRTLGIENFGLSPGLSYYHKSGLYGDVSGFWSKDFDPSYYLTVASIGYMHSFSKKISFMAGYDRYFYNIRSDDEYIPYKNTLSVTPIVDLKPVLLSINYAFYFGDAYVHRIMPGVSLVLEKKKILKIDRVAISPTFFMLLGNETITELEYDGPSLKNRIEYGTWFRIIETNKNVFGVMNYAFSLPLTVSHKAFGFSFTYTYNIPKALPGEPLTISESSFLSGSITYFINFKRKKFPL
jgi:hypothetical protein